MFFFLQPLLLGLIGRYLRLPLTGMKNGNRSRHRWLLDRKNATTIFFILFPYQNLVAVFFFTVHITNLAGCTTPTTPLFGADNSHEGPRRPTAANKGRRRGKRKPTKREKGPNDTRHIVWAI